MNRAMTLLFTLAMTLGGYAARREGDTNAAEVLARARAALGGEKQLSKVQGLSCTGTIQRTIGDRNVSGELTIDLQLPDKMLRTESISPMGDGALVVNEQGISGDVLLRSMRTVNAPAGMFIRTPPPPAPGSDAETQALRNSRAELARLAFSLLLSTQAAVPIEITNGGEAESPDGKADVVDAKGPGGFAARLFVDQQTRRPLMLAYRGASPRMMVQTQRVQGPPPAGGRAEHGDAPNLPAPEIVDISLFFDDYRSVDGVTLPHHLSRSVDGQTVEEWTFKTIKINPAFKPDTFAKK